MMSDEEIYRLNIAKAVVNMGYVEVSIAKLLGAVDLEDQNSMKLIRDVAAEANAHLSRAADAFDAIKSSVEYKLDRMEKEQGL